MNKTTNNNGFHKLEVCILPNGKKSPVLVWHKNEKDKINYDDAMQDYWQHQQKYK